MRVVVGSILSVIGLAACGGSSPMSANTGSSPTGGKGGGVSTAVTIADYSYSPGTIPVSAGTTVKWTNTGMYGHTVTSDMPGGFDSGTINGPMGDGYGGMTAGGSFSHTFSSAGTYAYHCSIHGAAVMHGTITVNP